MGGDPPRRGHLLLRRRRLAYLDSGPQRQRAPLRLRVPVAGRRRLPSDGPGRAEPAGSVRLHPTSGARDGPGWRRGRAQPESLGRREEQEEGRAKPEALLPRPQAGRPRAHQPCEDQPRLRDQGSRQPDHAVRVRGRLPDAGHPGSREELRGHHNRARLRVRLRGRQPRHQLADLAAQAHPRDRPRGRAHRLPLPRGDRLRDDGLTCRSTCEARPRSRRPRKPGRSRRHVASAQHLQPGGDGGTGPAVVPGGSARAPVPPRATRRARAMVSTPGRSPARAARSPATPTPRRPSTASTTR